MAALCSVPPVAAGVRAGRLAAISVRAGRFAAIGLRSGRLAAAVLPVLVLALGCLAAPPARAEEAAAVAARFTAAAGWKAREAAAVEKAAVTAPAAGPVTAALIFTDALDKPVPRMRERLSYGVVTATAAGAPVSLALVEVGRFNLGPAIRRMTIADYGDAAGPAEFGLGPHVGWRFVFQSADGGPAKLIAASRRTFSDAEAARQRCDGTGCLQLDADDPHDWQEIKAPAAPWAAAIGNKGAAGKGPGGQAGPARAAAELLALAGLMRPAGGKPQWQAPEVPEAGRPGEPFLFVIAERDLSNESYTDVRLGLTRLNDDALSAMWWRRLDFGEGPATFYQAPVRRSR